MRVFAFQRIIYTLDKYLAKQFRNIYQLAIFGIDLLWTYHNLILYHGVAHLPRLSREDYRQDYCPLINVTYCLY